jgi:hypothetical protein
VGLLALEKHMQVIGHETVRNDFCSIVTTLLKELISQREHNTVGDEVEASLAGAHRRGKSHETDVQLSWESRWSSCGHAGSTAIDDPRLA